MRSGSAVSTCLRPEWVPDYPYTECEAILSLRFSQQPPADFFQLPLAEQCLPHAAEVVSPHGTLGQVISKALGSTIAIATVHHLPLPPALPTRGQVEEAFKKLRARVGAGGFAEQHRLSPDQCYLRAEAMAQYLLKNKLPAYKIFVYPNTFCNDPDTQQDYCYHVAACVPCSDMQGNITVLMFDPWWSPSELPVTVELWLRQNGARQGAHHVDILSWMTFCPIEANDNENSQFIYRMIQQALEGNLYGK
jgi:hypothetical protein